MPIFHDPDLRLASDEEEKEAVEQTKPFTPMRRLSEESLRTEFCDGPEPGFPQRIISRENGTSIVTGKDNGNTTSDREDLIKRIKRGESPTWIPSAALKQEMASLEPKEDKSGPSSSPSQARGNAILLPPAEISNPAGKPKEELTIEERDPLIDIERPRSALHSGNFWDANGQLRNQLQNPTPPSSSAQAPSLEASSSAPWNVPQRLGEARGEALRHSERYPEWSDRRPLRSRAPSLQSYSSIYVLKAPTTPLVQQSNNEDLDFSDISPVDLSDSPGKRNRRHTLPPNLSSMNGHHSPASQPTYQSPTTRRINSSPYQGHRPKRSLTSTWSLQSVGSPQSSRDQRSRRPSFSSETAAMQRASMVGSYEESILRGWMSTAPSKPLDFTAQIGVLGKAGCRPKCPAHVTVPFPAVFYSYGNGDSGRTAILDEPSPYVGHIDLQSNLPPAEPASSGYKRHRPAQREDGDGHIGSDWENGEEDDAQTRKRKKRRRVPPEQDVPPGGSYRIPQQGQLQIVIKNPNKTAVKLFLVPYDLIGMEAGTKTFLRQRSYSAGTPIDHALSSENEGTKRISIGLDPRKKPTLRYLIHLNICCPSKGRFYLYQSIRVVFANRVPDDKEQLQQDIQLPQPRYSPYRTSRDPLTPSSSMGTKTTAEKAFRRRSSGFASEPEVMSRRYTQSLDDGPQYPQLATSPPPPVPAIPFDLAISRVRPHVRNGHDYDGAMDDEYTQPTSTTADQHPILGNTTSRPSRKFSGSSKSNSSNSSDGYAKLSKGDNGYGGFFGRPSTPEPGEGLLARRLRGLGLQKGDVPDCGP